MSVCHEKYNSLTRSDTKVVVKKAIISNASWQSREPIKAATGAATAPVRRPAGFESFVPWPDAVRCH